MHSRWNYTKVLFLFQFFFPFHFRGFTCHFTWCRWRAERSNRWPNSPTECSCCSNKTNPIQMLKYWTIQKWKTENLQSGREWFQDEKAQADDDGQEDSVVVEDGESGGLVVGHFILLPQHSVQPNQMTNFNSKQFNHCWLLFVYLSSFSFLFIFLSSAIFFEISRLMASSLFTATCNQNHRQDLFGYFNDHGFKQNTLCFKTNLVFL